MLVSKIDPSRKLNLFHEPSTRAQNETPGSEPGLIKALVLDFLAAPHKIGLTTSARQTLFCAPITQLRFPGFTINSAEPLTK